jgi:hypothetical protein
MGAKPRGHAGRAGPRGGDNNEEEYSDSAYRYSTNVAVVARNDAAFGALNEQQGWDDLAPDPNQWVWTDDYSNIIGALVRQMR